MRTPARKGKMEELLKEVDTLADGIDVEKERPQDAANEGSGEDACRQD